MMKKIKQIRRGKSYFSGPTSEIIKGVLAILLLGGAVAIAATSPYFIVNILKSQKFKNLKKYSNKKNYDTFYRLRKQGYIDFYKKSGQLYFLLTEKGRRKAGWLNVDNLKINKPKKWDGKWRILLFDIAEMKRNYREALRGKLINLGFKLFQKSAWIIPYECEKEIRILKNFFGLSEKEIKLIVAENIENDNDFKKIFKLK